MIGRREPSTLENRREFERRPASPSGRLKLLILAAILLVFAGIALVDQAEKKQLAEGPSGFYASDRNEQQQPPAQGDYSNNAMVSPRLLAYLGNQANFYDNNSSANDLTKADRGASPASSKTEAAAIATSAAAVPLIANRSGRPVTKLRDSSSLRTPEQHRLLSRKRQRLYSKNSPVLARRNLAPRHRYVQEPGTAFETRTIRSYASVYPRYRKRTTVLGTAGKIITAPVKILLSPFKKKEYYD